MSHEERTDTGPYVVWLPYGPLPTPQTLALYLWGGAPDRWLLETDDGLAASPYWGRLTMGQRGGAGRLVISTALVDQDEHVQAYSPFDRAAGGARLDGRLRDLATAHRVRFRHVLQRHGFTAMAVIAAEGEGADHAILPLAAACEVARLTGGMVVDRARNIGSPAETAVRRGLHETAVAWLHEPGRHPALVGQDDILTVRCRLTRVPFGTAPDDVAGGVSRGDAPRWSLWSASPPVAAPNNTATPPGSDQDIGLAAEATPLAQGRMAPLSEPGAYQASVDVRRYRAGASHILYLHAPEGLVAIRNSTLTFTLYERPTSEQAPARPISPIGDPDVSGEEHGWPAPAGQVIVEDLSEDDDEISGMDVDHGADINGLLVEDAFSAGGDALTIDDAIGMDDTEIGVVQVHHRAEINGLIVEEALNAGGDAVVIDDAPGLDDDAIGVVQVDPGADVDERIVEDAPGGSAEGALRPGDDADAAEDGSDWGEEAPLARATEGRGEVGHPPADG